LQKAAPNHVDNVRDDRFDHPKPTQMRDTAGIFVSNKEGIRE